MENKTALIVGYTGATGKALVNALILDSYFEKIVLIGRRKVELPKGADDRFVQEVINFNEIENHKDVFKGCSVGFCVLGTLTAVAGKGQAEEGATSFGFKKLFNYRPSVLIADRQQTRPLETFFLCCFCCCIKFCRNQWVMPVEVLANAMINRTKTPPQENVEILDNVAIDRIAQQ